MALLRLLPVKVTPVDRHLKNLWFLRMPTADHRNLFSLNLKFQLNLKFRLAEVATEVYPASKEVIMANHRDPLALLEEVTEAEASKEADMVKHRHLFRDLWLLRLLPAATEVDPVNRMLDTEDNHQHHRAAVMVADQVSKISKVADMVLDNHRDNRKDLQLHPVAITADRVNKEVEVDTVTISKYPFQDLQFLPGATVVDPVNKQVDSLAISPRDLPLHQVVITKEHPVSKEVDMVEDRPKDQFRDQRLLPPVMELDQVNKEVEEADTTV